MFKLPELSYAFNSLEPYIDEETMKLHHGKHHLGYVDKLNDALKEYQNLQEDSIEDLLRQANTLPEEISQKVIDYGGGHANHSLFWEIMAPPTAAMPEGELKIAIERTFGSFEEFKRKLSQSAANRFGSGWAWLATDNGELNITDTKNQDSLYMQGLVPVMGIDVWEHAYYLKYKNKRQDYIDAWWNVVNWNKVREKYEIAIKNLPSE